MNASSTIIKRNLALIGPPGSGKGSYGKLFAQHFDIPLVTVSDVLRQYAHDIPSCGSLLDDSIVSNVLCNHLPFHQHYILDGFPRTLNQVHLMETTWPQELQMEAVIDLNVPKPVCKAKLLGRRYCTKCKGNFNVNAVHELGFHLPAQLPSDCHDCKDDGEFFTSRPDDVESVVDERLTRHFQETQPILEYFEKKERLLRFAPYMGYDDVPRFHEAVETWLRAIGRPSRERTTTTTR